MPIVPQEAIATPCSRKRQYLIILLPVMPENAGRMPGQKSQLPKQLAWKIPTAIDATLIFSSQSAVRFNNILFISACPMKSRARGPAIDD